MQQSQKTHNYHAKPESPSSLPNHLQLLNIPSFMDFLSLQIFFRFFICLISYNSEIFLLFCISCHCPLTLLVRGSYLNSTALFSGLGIALAYLVNLNMLKVINTKHLFQMGGLMSWRMAALVPPFLICIAIPILVIMKV